MENNQETSNSKKKSYTGWILFVIIVIGITLPFHYLPERLMVFPKNELTFSNTIIWEEDVDKLIELYNNASFFEKQTIRQEPLVRKLMEKGIIISETDK
ncbi:MAG: hypothetical protein GX677_09480 [Treponema sp.]|nr:hypothetical protein [Treponema sp.]